MRVQLQVAKLYRKLGREEEAKGVKSELLKLLAYAEPDHPILAELKPTLLPPRDTASRHEKGRFQKEQ